MKRLTLAIAAMTAFTAPAFAQADAAATQPAAPKTAPGVDVDRLFPLQVGDRAPELSISEWIKGEPVTGFDKGRVYVVEFWATWCGPCIASMPHISELQKKYAEKGVRIIGVNIWDDPALAAPFINEGRGADRTDYTIAIEEKIEGEDPRRNGMMAKNWMRAAGRNGIPSAFIVDQKGYVAWAGHPASMDEPLAQVVAGEWDLAKAAKDHVETMRFQKTQMEFQDAVRSGDAERAGEIGAEMIKAEHIWNSASSLNQIAWMFVDPDGPMGGKNNDLALKAAERAVELTNNEDGMIMDTLAWAQFYAGQYDEAMRTEQKSVDLAENDQLREQLQQSLDRMKQMIAKKTGDG